MAGFLMRQPGLTLTPRLVLSGIALLTLWRVAMLWANRTDLWVDESQYWLWGSPFPSVPFRNRH